MNPDDLIRQLLGQERTPNEYVDENFPRPSHDRFLPDAPEPSVPVIDRTHSEEDDPSAQEYIQRAFEELAHPRVDESYVLPDKVIRPRY